MVGSTEAKLVEVVLLNLLGDFDGSFVIFQLNELILQNFWLILMLLFGQNFLVSKVLGDFLQSL